MKKVFLLLVSLVLLSGCTITRMDTKTYDEVIDKVLSLNIKLSNNITLNLDNLHDKLKRIHGNGSFGDVLFLEAYLSTIDEKITKKGAILFPVKTVYDTDTLEYVSSEKLRDTLNLKDGDKVIIKIEK